LDKTVGSVQGWSMSEWMMMLAITASTALFAIGGTGYKWARRFVLPVLLGGIALLYAPWWACVGYGATLSVHLCMGYGESSSWLKRAFVFSGYGTSALWLGWSWWVVITPVLCLILFILSNNRLTEKSFTWKIVEAGYGFLLGAGFIGALLNQWRVL